MGRQATNYLSNKLQHKISIGKIDVPFYNRVILEDVYVDGVQRDTLISMKKIDVLLGVYRFFPQRLVVKHLDLEDGVAYLRNDSVTGDFNFQYLVDFFSTSKKEEESKPFPIIVKHLKLKDIHFKLDDMRDEPIPFGMDYSHLDIKRVNVLADDINIFGLDIKAKIKHISAREKSGFILSKLISDFHISNKGMFFDNLKILTPNSAIRLPHLYFKMNGLSKFRTFVDDVAFDSQLSMSTVGMRDITYFAPELKGMDEVVQVQAEVMDRIKDLKINNIQLFIKDQTQIQGNLILPDFRYLEGQAIEEEISYAMLNLHEMNSVKLPLGGETAQTLNLDTTILHLGFAEISNLRTSGTITDFFFNLGKVKTALGSIEVGHNIRLYKKAENLIGFNEVLNGESDSSKILIQNFDLGTLIGFSDLGVVDGNLNLEGEFSPQTGIAFQNVKGHLNQLGYRNYSYTNIDFKEVSYKDLTVNGMLNVKDPNADFTFDGNLDFGKVPAVSAMMQLNRVELNELNLFDLDTTLLLNGEISANLSGIDGFGLNGKVNLADFCLTNGGKEFYTKDAFIELTNFEDNNSIYLRSDILDVDISGIINYNTVFAEVEKVLAQAMPVFFDKPRLLDKKLKKQKIRSDFNFSLNLKKIDNLLSIFIDRLNVENGTKIFGTLYSSDSLELTLKSPNIQFYTFKATNLNFYNKFTDKGSNIRYVADRVYANDSLEPFDSLLFVTRGITDSLTSFIKWGRRNIDFSGIKWTTRIKSLDDIVFHIEKSLFTIDSHKWNLMKEVDIAYKPDAITVDSLILTHENQFITIDGEYGRMEGKQLSILIKDLDLTDLSDILNLQVKLEGTANGDLKMSNPKGIFRLSGNTTVEKLILNGNELGDVNLLGGWNEPKRAITMIGELTYRDAKTFNILGNYYVDRKKDYLDFNLFFNKTKIDFLSSLMDPEVISNIRGYLDGSLTVRGELDHPTIKGALDLTKGNVKIGMFGVNYGFSGTVKTFDDLITFDNMPLMDEEGNTGTLTGSIIHDHFSDFNFDVFIGLDNLKHKDGSPATSFLGMNTHYKDGTLYYGKAYVKGWVGISGYLDNLDVEVNLSTRKNTSITLPMYGAENVSDQLSYNFTQKDTVVKVVSASKLNMTGVNLKLNFNVTPDARINLVFNDLTGEEISASGSGNISINYDNEENLTMDGTYRLKDGYYNFVFNPIKKKFVVESGSSVSWRGEGPTDADLSITAVYKVNTDISKIAPELESQSTASSNQDVYAKIFITGRLDAPQLAFQLAAPSASESAKATIDRINTDNDELNKQFFMLLLTGHFQSSGVAGIGSNGTNAALEAVAGQINNLLNNVSKDVRLNVDLRNDDLSGKNSQALGFETNLLNDKLIIKGNFGVRNDHSANEGSTNTSFIGDLSLQYIIDAAGNLRINVFNESNSYSLIQNKDLGMFTQGVGMIYQESFTKFNETNFANFIADLFRKDKHFKYTRRRKQKLLPPKQPVMKPEEDEK